MAAIDILTGFPGWSVDFDLQYSMTISGKTAIGKTQVVETGTPLWRTSYQSREMRANELSYWRAKLAKLRGGLITFQGRDTSRCYPISDPRGTIIDNYVKPTLILDFINNYSLVSPVASAGVRVVSISDNIIGLSGLPPGYTLSVGDLFSYVLPGGKTILAKIVTGGTSNGGGFVTVEIEPRPAYGAATGMLVLITRPWVEMMLVPGSLSTPADVKTGRGSVSFQAQEVR